MIIPRVTTPQNLGDDDIYFIFRNYFCEKEPGISSRMPV